MREYSCPDCERTDSCDGCPRVIASKEKTNRQLHIPEYFPDSITWNPLQYIPQCCVNCANHPSNNPYASGVCNCALPALTTRTF